MRLAIADEDRAPPKPREGEPCNGCGLCCTAEVCTLGLAAFGDRTPAPCPAIRFHDGRFWCGVIEMADRLAPDSGAALRLMLGVGRGCDSED